MKQQSIIYGVVGLVIGVLLTGFVMGSQNNKTPEKSNSTMTHESSSSDDNSKMSMEEMMSDLKGKSGDKFDKAFLESMIAHHEDALTMAKDAKELARRDEIKKLADEIISAQTSEIDQMKKWQKEWGFSK
ncbi:MAG TPA: DUF305 domain-containing protein [Candidatus Limnocylindrales bacterium]|nr:DUF305 domain-containing protein [Candidatus Limnocylindrales bacterium]